VGLPLLISEMTVEGDDGRPILSVGHLAVAPGTRLGVRGPSGAGKSTLLHALAGLAVPATGSIRWGETNIGRLPESKRTEFRRHHIGMVFQDFLLFEELSAFGNAALTGAFAERSRRPDIDRNAAELLVRLGLTAETGRQVTTFSGGERQRVAIARALSHDPAIILADEPTASLDRNTADRLIDDLASLTRLHNRTLIAVSHDYALLSRMDRIVDLADGALTGETGHG